MARLNVRCCCQPTKILGTLEILSLPPHASQCPGMYNRTTVAVYALEEFFVSDGPLLSPSTTAPYKKEIVQLRSFGHRELAVYSEERPIEFWRGILGFEENDNI